MKRRYLLLLVMFLIPIISKAYTGSSGMSYQDCVAFSDPYRNIANSYEYKICYRAACSTTGVWTLANMGTSGYRCTNGNAEPKIEISDGCSQFTGSCTLNSGHYCTVVKKINCNLTKDGKTYSNPSTSTETQSQTPVTVKSSSGTKKKSSSIKTKGTEVTVNTKTKETLPTRPVITDSTVTTTEPVAKNNTNIKKLVINGQEVSIDNENNEYNINVPFGVTDIDVNVETEAQYASVSVIGNKNLTDEDSDLIISITAEDGTQRNILFHIKRYYKLSEDCTLKYIKINNEDVNKYNKDNFKYTVKVNKEVQTLKISTEPNDNLHSTYEIVGNKDLKNKSVVTINVTAEDGSVCSYQITVKKPSGIWIPIVIIIIIVGILIGVGYYAYGYFKRSKDQYKYE